MSEDHGVGHTWPPQPVAWLQRDLLIYAAGVGATMDEPNIAYELAPGWAPLPTYPVVLAFKGVSQDVVNFETFKKLQQGAPGAPDTSKSVGVHAEQAIEILRPLPQSALPNEGWQLRRQLTGLADSGKGLRSEVTSTLVDGNGTEYARLVSMSYTAGEFGLNKWNKFITPKPPIEPLPKPPNWDADKVIRETPPQNISITYRLSGDYNPLHIDPQIGKKLFDGTINHGLNAFGYAARHLIKAFGDGEPGRLVYLKVKFASPVKPGDGLETRMWKGDVLNDGRQAIHLVQINQKTGKAALAGAVALMAPGKTDSKL